MLRMRGWCIVSLYIAHWTTIRKSFISEFYYWTPRSIYYRHSRLNVGVTKMEESAQKRTSLRRNQPSKMTLKSGRLVLSTILFRNFLFRNILCPQSSPVRRAGRTEPVLASVWHRPSYRSELMLCSVQNPFLPWKWSWKVFDDYQLIISLKCNYYTYSSEHMKNWMKLCQYFHPFSVFRFRCCRFTDLCSILWLEAGIWSQGSRLLDRPLSLASNLGTCYQQTSGVHSVLVSCVLVLRKQPKTRNMQYDAKLLACLM